MQTDRDLIGKALGVCHVLTYNEEPQGSAKHLLRELSHRLERARELNCDQVALMLAAITRYLPPRPVPAVSRARELSTYALLYELMEVAGLAFADDAAASNGTPPDVQRLRRKPLGVEAARTGFISGAAASLAPQAGAANGGDRG